MRRRVGSSVGRGVVACAALAGALGLARAQDAGADRTLEPGKSVRLKLDDAAGELALRFDAPGPGLLALAARGGLDMDLALVVCDEDGQPLPNGEGDVDDRGNPAAEQLAVAIPAAGRYRVVVVGLSEEGGEVLLAASWLDVPELAVPADPDGRPGAARALEVGASATDRVAPAEGDLWDWYVLAPAQAGTLTIVTRVEDPEHDLRLEVYDPVSFREPLEASDQDLDGSKGNEQVSLSVTAGQKVYVRVRPVFLHGEGLRYKLSSGLVPE